MKAVSIRFMKTRRDLNGRERKHRTILYIIGYYINNAVSCQLENYSESIG